MKGCFIVFEGIDGSGKSTQFNELGKKLQNEKYKVVLTREPTRNRPIGKLIRKILYNHTTVSEEALALLFAADRADHTLNKIIPALRKNEVVLSDRYVYSSFAYQGKGMDIELNIDWLRTINRFAQTPDIVIFLDIEPHTGLERLQQGQRRVQDDQYFEDVIKQEKIRSGYYQVLNIEKRHPDLLEFQNYQKIKKNNKIDIISLNGTKIIRVNGTLQKDEIHKGIYKIIKKHLKEKSIYPLEKPKPSPNKLMQYSGK